ncbi:MAG: hypothetical protein WC464_02160 [Bdellovibrionales bacterium]
MLPLDKETAAALRDAPQLVISTVALMQELTRVLASEADIVTKRKMTEHPALLKNKQRLAVDYRANMKSIAAHPEILKALSDDAKQAIRLTAKRLAATTDANARMLRTAVDATRLLIQNIMAMVRSEVMPQMSYKNHAKRHLMLGSRNPVCRPVAIHRSV